MASADPQKTASERAAKLEYLCLLFIDRDARNQSTRLLPNERLVDRLEYMLRCVDLYSAYDFIGQARTATGWVHRGER